MNIRKKGFTLVELLAVLVILGIVLAIVATNVFGILQESKDDSYDTQIEMLKQSTKEYVSDNKTKLFKESDTICVSIYDLYKNKYITEIPEDPRNGKDFSEYLGFIAEKDGENITYTLTDDVDKEEKCK